MLRCVLLVTAVGCGRVAFDPRSTDALASDAACTFGPFSTPVKLDAAVQSVDDEWFPTPALADTQLYFYSYRAPSQGADLWVATRPDAMSPFNAPALVADLNTGEDEMSPSITDDALTMVFTVRYAADMDRDILISDRAATTAPWGPAVLAIPSPTSDFTSWISGDGLLLWFTSGRTGGIGRLDLYEATRTDRTSAFGTARHAAEINSAEDDECATTSTDGLTVFFSSDRPGGPGLQDVYTARRTTRSEPFGVPVLVPELSSVRDDYALRLSADGTKMYLNYDTLTAGGGQADLYVATRSCL